VGVHGHGVTTFSGKAGEAREFRKMVSEKLGESKKSGGVAGSRVICLA